MVSETTPTQPVIMSLPSTWSRSELGEPIHHPLRVVAGPIEPVVDACLDFPSHGLNKKATPRVTAATTSWDWSGSRVVSQVRAPMYTTASSPTTIA